jgi:hypothetical protein
LTSSTFVFDGHPASSSSKVGQVQNVLGKAHFPSISLGISTQNRRQLTERPFQSLESHRFGWILLWGWSKTIDFEELPFGA